MNFDTEWEMVMERNEYFDGEPSITYGAFVRLMEKHGLKDHPRLAVYRAAYEAEEAAYSRLSTHGQYAFDRVGD